MTEHHNEAAERLHIFVMRHAETQEELSLDAEALAEERRAAVERIRKEVRKAQGFAGVVIATNSLNAILDAEADR